MAEQQKLNVVQRFVAWLAKVTAVDVGKENDGLIRQDRDAIVILDLAGLQHAARRLA